MNFYKYQQPRPLITDYPYCDTRYSPSYRAYDSRMMPSVPDYGYQESNVFQNSPVGRSIQRPQYSPPYEFDNESSQSQSLLQKLEMTGRVPSREKFRRMICQTYICCGGCPYNERCVFLHDDRIELHGFKTRPNKQSKACASPKDSFFWPDMHKEKVWQKVDYLGLPSVNQHYDIPLEFSRNINDYHDRSIFSLWNHFVTFCYKSNHGCEQLDIMDEMSSNLDSPFAKHSQHSPWRADDDYRSPMNQFIPGAKRLPIFVKLSSTEEDTYPQSSSHSLWSPKVIDKFSFKNSPKISENFGFGHDSPEENIDWVGDILVDSYNDT